MTSELRVTLADHAAGNYRVLMNLADELLAVAADRELARLDEKLFLEVFAQTPKTKPAASAPETMTLGELHRLLIAPEIIVVDLADAALLALGRALLARAPPRRATRPPTTTPSSGVEHALSCAPPHGFSVPCTLTAVLFSASSEKPTPTMTRFEPGPSNPQSSRPLTP